MTSGDRATRPSALAVFRVELLRQRRRLLLYAFPAAQLVIAAVMHRLLLSPDPGLADWRLDSWITMHLLAGLPLLILAGLLLSLPLLERDAVPGGRETILMSGLAEPIYVLAKFSTIVVILFLLLLNATGAAAVSCWLHYGQAPIGTIAWTAIILLAAPAFLFAAAGLFIGGLVRPVFGQLLAFFASAAGASYAAHLILDRWDHMMSLALLDFQMIFVWDAHLRIEALRYPDSWTRDFVDAEGGLWAYEWRPILAQRGFLLLVGSVLVVAACGVVRLRARDYSRLWIRAKLPFRSYMHRFLIFDARGWKFWAALGVVLALAIGAGEAFVARAVERIALVEKVAKRLPGEIAKASNGNASVQISHIDLDVTVGSRLRPLDGRVTYGLAASTAGTVTFLLNPGFEIRSVRLDDRDAESHGDADRVEIDCGAAGHPRELTIEYGGFLADHYRATSLEYVYWNMARYLSLSLAPAMLHMRSDGAWLLPSDRWLPVVDAPRPFRQVTCHINVHAPAEWNVCVPMSDSGSVEEGGFTVHRFAGEVGVADVEMMPIVAMPCQVVRLGGMGANVEVACRDPQRLLATPFPKAIEGVRDYLAEIVPGNRRPVLAVEMPIELLGAAEATPALFIPFDAGSMNPEGPPHLRGIEHLMPTHLLAGRNSLHQFFSDGLTDYLAQSFLMGRLGVRHIGVVSAVAGDSSDRGIVLAKISTSKRLGNMESRRASWKATRILFALENLLGPERMLAVMRTFFEQYADAETRPEDLIRITNAEAARAGVDLSWFWDDYYLGAKLPYYSVEEARAWRTPSGSYIATARIVNKWDGRMVVPYMIEMAGDRWQGRVFVDKEAVIRVETHARPTTLVIDPAEKAYRAPIPEPGRFEMVAPPADDRGAR